MKSNAKSSRLKLQKIILSPNGKLKTSRDKKIPEGSNSANKVNAAKRVKLNRKSKKSKNQSCLK